MRFLRRTGMQPGNVAARPLPKSSSLEVSAAHQDPWRGSAFSWMHACQLGCHMYLDRFATGLGSHEGNSLRQSLNTAGVSACKRVGLHVAPIAMHHTPEDHPRLTSAGDRLQLFTLQFPRVTATLLLWQQNVAAFVGAWVALLLGLSDLAEPVEMPRLCCRNTAFVVTLLLWQRRVFSRIRRPISYQTAGAAQIGCGESCTECSRLCTPWLCL